MYVDASNADYCRPAQTPPPRRHGACKTRLQPKPLCGFSIPGDMSAQFRLSSRTLACHVLGFVFVQSRIFPKSAGLVVARIGLPSSVCKEIPRHSTEPSLTKRKRRQARPIPIRRAFLPERQGESTMLDGCSLHPTSPARARLMGEPGTDGVFFKDEMVLLSLVFFSRVFFFFLFFLWFLPTREYEQMLPVYGTVCICPRVCRAAAQDFPTRSRAWPS